MVSNAFTLTFLILYQNYFSLLGRVLSSQIIVLIIFFATTILVTVTVNGTSLFYLTLISTILCGCATAFLSGGLFGLTATFPPEYTGALMSGQGLAGLVVSGASMLTIIGGKVVDYCTDDDAGDDGECEQSVDYSALSFFAMSCVVLLIAIILIIVLLRLPFTKYV
jgi:hypothetical protein